MVTYLIQLNKSFTFNQTLGYRFHKELLEFAFVSTLNLLAAIEFVIVLNLFGSSVWGPLALLMLK